MFAALGTSSVVVSSGLLAWQLYQVQNKQQQAQESITCDQQPPLVEQESTKPQFIPVPQHILSMTI